MESGDAEYAIGDTSQMKKEVELEKSISVGAFKSASMPKNQRLKIKVN